MNSLTINLWQRQARQWSHVGPPLRPGPQDIAFTRAAISEWLRTANRTAPRFLIMGVTPELCGLTLNHGSRLLALDRSAGMIGAVGPGRSTARGGAICADWRHMPVAPASVDLALGDGFLSSLTYPSDYSVVFAELRRVLRPGGRCVIRCFVQTDVLETPDDVFADLSQGRIGSFHALKLRLAMAMQSDPQAGVVVETVWSILHSKWPELDRLAKCFAWPLEEVLTIQAYRNVDTRYSFPALAQYGEFFAGAGFSTIQLATPSYELGGRCPTFVLEPDTIEAPGP